MPVDNMNLGKRKCYNCGPEAPQDTDEKWLCERCSEVFVFTDHGRMIRRPTEERRHAGRDRWRDGGFNPTISERRTEERATPFSHINQMIVEVNHQMVTCETPVSKSYFRGWLEALTWLKDEVL